MRFTQRAVIIERKTSNHFLISLYLCPYIFTITFSSGGMSTFNSSNCSFDQFYLDKCIWFWYQSKLFNCMLLIWWQLKPLIDTFIKPLMLIKKLVSFMTDFFKDSWNFCVVMRDEPARLRLWKTVQRRILLSILWTTWNPRRRGKGTNKVCALFYSLSARRH